MAVDFSACKCNIQFTLGGGGGHARALVLRALAFLRQNTFAADGNCPLNTCGGQLSCGQAGAAGGFLGLVEAIRQLTGQTLGARLPNARRGLVAGYGMVTYDRGVCSGAAVVGA